MGVIRLDFQFMVGLLSKKANQQMLIKAFPMVGMFITLSLVYNESWVHNAAFNKTSKNVTPRTQLSAAQVSRWARWRNALRISDLWFSLVSGWRPIEGQAKGNKQELYQAVFCWVKYWSSYSKWGYTQFSDETCLKFLREDCSGVTGYGI